MNITEVRNVIRQVIAEAKAEGGLKKSNGKLVDLKNELKGLKGMREALGQYQIAEGDESTPGFVAEYAHMQRFVNELEKIKEAHARLAEMLDNQISQVEGKVSSETEKIKEMMGLIEKAKKPAAKKDDKKAEKKEKKEEDLEESFASLEKKVEKSGKSKKAATKIAGAVANAKMHGAGSGPTAKQSARVKQEGLPKGYWEQDKYKK
jgi:flagellar biosynthesis chaperone FliJ